MSLFERNLAMLLVTLKIKSSTVFRILMLFFRVSLKAQLLRSVQRKILNSM